MTLQEIAESALHEYFPEETTNQTEAELNAFRAGAQVGFAKAYELFSKTFNAEKSDATAQLKRAQLLADRIKEETWKIRIMSLMSLGIRLKHSMPSLGSQEPPANVTQLHAVE